MSNIHNASGVASLGRSHSPFLAALAGFALPGAGQAYNGSPIRGLFVLVTTPLVLPWLLGSFFAHRRAAAMQREGGRFGKGGVIWILLHGWLVFNLLLAVVAGLTMWGVWK